MLKKDFKLQHVDGVIIDGQYYGRIVTGPTDNKESIRTLYANKKQLDDCIKNDTDSRNMVDMIEINQPYYDMENIKK